jgi:hypothetical protein
VGAQAFEPRGQGSISLSQIPIMFCLREPMDGGEEQEEGISGGQPGPKIGL